MRIFDKVRVEHMTRKESIYDLLFLPNVLVATTLAQVVKKISLFVIKQFHSISFLHTIQNK